MIDPGLQTLVAWARVTVGWFARATVSDPGPACRALADRAPLARALRVPPGSLGDDPDAKTTGWFGIGLNVLTRDPGALGRLIRACEGTPLDLVLLGLAALVETDHLGGLALAELQSEGEPRPSLHLVGAMLEAVLPGAGVSPATIAAAPLVEAGALTIAGEGPLPRRSLSCDPRLVATLAQPGRPWPGCRLLEAGPAARRSAALEAQLGPTAALLAGGQARVLVLRALPGAGRGRAAAAVAEHLSLRALDLAGTSLRDQPALAAACAAGRWLPVLRPAPASGELLSAETWRGFRGPVVIILGRHGAVEGSDVVELELPPATEAERERWWSESLGDADLARRVAPSVLGPPLVESVGASARVLAARRGQPVTFADVAQSRRRLAADALGTLAQPVEREVPRGALVVGAEVGRQLDDLVLRCHRRESLWRELGPTLACTQSLGVRALFVGESGTGKTLAASYLASALGAPLYRVDLAAVMNKYVGESEKNLGRLLDLAAGHDVVLLFDEADALFGRRSDGGDTGERYANMLTNFLLTRIEVHPGIAILTSNARLRIDRAFTRRLDTVIEFPLPGPQERGELWRSHLGARSPDDTVCQTLGNHCDLPGGHVRNVVLAAAARATGPVIPFGILIDELGREYRKLGRPMPARLQARPES